MSQSGEIKNETVLCNTDGTLSKSSIGWFRRPIVSPNLKGHLFRKKKWNYWCVYSENFLFSVTIADIDYAATAFVYFLDFSSLSFIEKSQVSVFPMNIEKSISLGDGPFGDCMFRKKGFLVEFKKIGNDYQLNVDVARFGSTSLSARIVLTDPEKRESLGVVVPWGINTFQYTSKHNGLPAQGMLKIGDKTLSLDGDSTLGFLDFGRGVWPYSTTWNWASFGTKKNGSIFGVNLGGKWTDHAPFNENAYYLNGKMHKIMDDVLFHYDNKNYNSTWEIKSKNSDSVSLRFEPIFERVARDNFLFLKTEVHQLIGKFNGKILTKDGPVSVKNAIGWSEEHIARW